MGSTFRPIEYESMYTSRFIEDCFEVFKHAWNSVYFKPIPIWQNFSSTLLLSIYVLELIDNKSFLHHFKQEIKILTINYFFFFFWCINVLLAINVIISLKYYMKFIKCNSYKQTKGTTVVHFDDMIHTVYVIFCGDILYMLVHCSD